MSKQHPQRHKDTNKLRVFVSSWLTYFVSALFLLVVTFPKIIPEFTLAIDPQIHWVFNYLWLNDFSQTQYIIFPHGPLTFLNFPLAMKNNLFWGLLIQAMLRLVFIFSFLHLAAPKGLKKWIVTILLLFFILQFMELDFILIGIVANGIFLNHFTQKNYWYVLAITAFALGFYIKISIGITALTILLSYLAYQSLISLFGEQAFSQPLILHKKDEKIHGLTKSQTIISNLLMFLAIPISLAIGWFLMYQNFDGFGKYLFGIKELVGGNSDSASLYPDNNWWLIGFSFLAFIAIPIIDFWKKGFKKSQSTWMVYILLGLSVFAVWKHSMAREDPWHIVKLFAWLMVFFSYFFILQKKTKWSSIVLSTLCLFFFHANIKSTLNMFINPLDTKDYKNFTEAFFHQKYFFQKNKTKSLQNIESCKLTDTDLALIGNQTVDCYPWNYAFIQANNLNWQPRPIIQSYAAYTPWLNEQNANHFSSKKAPQFLIWETDILKRDIWEGELTSIDQHYLLNDEPSTILNLILNYEVVSKSENYILFQKRKNTIAKKSEIKKTNSYSWNEWIDIPDSENEILRANFQYEKTFLKWLKAKTYKDEPIFIEYQFSNNEIRKYRFTSLNAEQGLWINPFIDKPSNDLIHAKTNKIRFSTANDFLVKNKFQIEWESFHSPTHIFRQFGGLFGKHISFSEFTLLEKKNLIPAEKILTSKEYSPSYEIPFSELNFDSTSSISIAASVEAKMSYHASGLLVIVVEQDGKVILWDGKRIEDFMTIYHKWEMAFSKKKIPNTASQNAVIKVYVWNTGDERFSIKDLSVKCIEHKKY